MQRRVTTCGGRRKTQPTVRDGLTTTSIERCLEEIVIEAIAMGGLTSAGRPKASVVQLRPKEGLKRD
ncbi:hypothetical protein APA30_32250 [Pseudomonas aeruginosa]|nr:hypothetical protein APA30_32250 [Pseudomonas aeruginosa]OPE08307.1 hypothetical protein APA54_32270 [Pseudomonas aeruginosa]